MVPELNFGTLEPLTRQRVSADVQGLLPPSPDTLLSMPPSGNAADVPAI